MEAPGGRVIGAMALEIEADRVVGINSVVNPEKLRHLGSVADMGRVLRGES